MTTIIDLIIKSGESGVNLTIYLLLPVMVVMMALMRTLEEKGVLAKIALLMAPLLSPFGLPGLGVFAMIQILLVSFAAPISTFKIIEQDHKISDAMRAATLATILVMSQANATFPLAVVGLNLPITILTSILGGLLSGFIAFKLMSNEDTTAATAEDEELKEEAQPKTKRSFIQSLFAGGEEGLQIALKSIPPLILSIFMVNVLRETGVILLVERLMSPILVRVGIPGVAVLPIVTKYLAGGTAMMAITMELISEGALSVVELNRIAGFATNPFDPVGIALLVSVGPRMGKVVRPAIIAALVGIVFRGILHIIIF